MGFFSGLKVAGNLIGGVVGLAGGHMANQTNKDLAMQNNATSIELANTAVQRRVADMEKAGINPLLAVSNAGGGASTPQLITPKMENISSKSVADAMAVASNAIQLQALKNDADLKKAQADNLDEDTRSKNIRNTLDEVYAEQERKLGLDTLKSNLRSDEFQRAYLNAKTEVEKDQLLMNAIEKDVKNADVAKKMQEKDNLEEMKKGIEKENARKEWELDLDKADVKNTKFGRNVKAVNDAIQSAIDTIGKGGGR